MGPPAVGEEVGATLGEVYQSEILRHGSQGPLQAHLHTHTHTGNTLTTLSTAQWGSHSRPSGTPGELGRGSPSGQAKPEPGRSIWWPSHPSPGWERNSQGHKARWAEPWPSRPPQTGRAGDQ